MAYLDLADAFSPSAARAIAAPDDILAQAPPASFDHTEWAVIAVARNDGLTSLEESRPSWLRRLIFGRPRSYALAAERLEALRRLAVEAWRQPETISLRALGTFMSVGYSSAQLALLLSTTGALPVMAKLISSALKTPAADVSLS